MSQIHARLSTPPAADAAEVETIVDPRPSGAGGFASRRKAPRFTPREGIRAEVRPWGAGAGPDVALELLDVSELGIRVRLKQQVRVSGQFEVTLRDATGLRLSRAMAVIRWSTRSPEGAFVVGLELARPLLPDVLRRLAGPPIPEPTHLRRS